MLDHLLALNPTDQGLRQFRFQQVQCKVLAPNVCVFLNRENMRQILSVVPLCPTILSCFLPFFTV